VILLDTVGELAAIYRFASIVFVGGSLVPKGGHNILEPALYAKPIVVGPHMENFREIASEFLRRKALLQLSGADHRALTAELRDALARLLGDKDYAETLGANARRAVDENRGATARTVEIISEYL
jgi:3-deoxy-D-manno-octulosonic-acid transferase